MSAIPLSLTHLPAGSPWWVFAVVVSALVLHISGGSVGIVSGYAAVSARKGEALHRAFGTLFLFSMLSLTMAAMGLSLSLWLHQRGNIAGGVLAAYLVATAWMTVRRKEGSIGRFETGAFLVALGASITLVIWGVQATMNPKGLLEGYPSALYFTFASFAAFFAALDLKVIRHGGVSGVQRIARHLWRMCLALFFAAASFFLGQQKVMPVFMHGSPLLFIPALAPLAIMVFWLLRIRLANWFGRAATAS